MPHGHAASNATTAVRETTSSSACLARLRRRGVEPVPSACTAGALRFRRGAGTAPGETITVGASRAGAGDAATGGAATRGARGRDATRGASLRTPTVVAGPRLRVRPRAVATLGAATTDVILHSEHLSQNGYGYLCICIYIYIHIHRVHDNGAGNDDDDDDGYGH